jgi:hypothetical protein
MSSAFTRVVSSILSAFAWSFTTTSFPFSVVGVPQGPPGGSSAEAYGPVQPCGVRR